MNDFSFRAAFKWHKQWKKSNKSFDRHSNGSSKVFNVLANWCYNLYYIMCTFSNNLPHLGTDLHAFFPLKCFMFVHKFIQNLQLRLISLLPLCCLFRLDYVFVLCIIKKWPWSPERRNMKIRQYYITITSERVAVYAFKQSIKALNSELWSLHLIL